MTKVFIHVEDACERRYLDANRIRDYLSKNGYEIVNKPSDAQIIILVTCAVFNRDAENALNKVKEFQKYDAELIVTGCLPDIEKERLGKIFNGKSISTKNLDNLDALFPDTRIKYACVDDANVLYQNLNKEHSIGALKTIFRKIKVIEKLFVRIKNHIFKNLLIENFIKYSGRSNQYYSIRISTGCLSNCSYCVTKKAVGNIKSKSVDTCVKEFKKGLNEGYGNFQITADEAGAYGLDIGSSLPELLDELTKIPGEYKITIRNFNPRWVVKYIDELENILKRGKIISLGIPIQSGNSRILKLMNRYSDAEKIKSVLIKLKNSFPNLPIITHGITGFPTETEKEFKDTLNFIKVTNINGYIFPFSCRTGSEAEKIEPKISQDEISKRFKYAKRFLKNAGYDVIYLPRKQTLFFDKRVYLKESRYK